MFTFEATKTTPFAPPELEGEYKLTIKGRHMKMTKVDDGIKARATCNKTDDWNMVDGINTCLGRIQGKKKCADKIKVGDKVKVVDSTCKYPNYVEWVVKNVENKVDVACFANGSQDDLTRMTGVVIAVAPHKYGNHLVYVRIENGMMPRCYLFNMDGLKKI